MTWLSGRSRLPWLQDGNQEETYSQPKLPDSSFTNHLPGPGEEINLPVADKNVNLRASAVDRLLGVIKVENQEEAKVVSSVVNRLVDYVSYQAAATEGECSGIIDELERWQDVLWWGAAAAQKAASAATCITPGTAPRAKGSARSSAGGGVVLPLEADLTQGCNQPRVRSAPAVHMRPPVSGGAWERAAAVAAAAPAPPARAARAAVGGAAGSSATLPPIPTSAAHSKQMAGIRGEQAGGAISTASTRQRTSDGPAATRAALTPAGTSTQQSTASAGNAATAATSTRAPSPSSSRAPSPALGNPALGNRHARPSHGVVDTGQPAVLRPVGGRQSSPGFVGGANSGGSACPAGSGVLGTSNLSTAAADRTAVGSVLRRMPSLWAYQEAMRRPRGGGRAGPGAAATSVMRLSTGLEWGQVSVQAQGPGSFQGGGNAHVSQVGFEGGVGRRLKEMAREQLDTIMKHESRPAGVGLSKRSLVAAASNMQMGGGAKDVDSD